MRNTRESPGILTRSRCEANFIESIEGPYQIARCWRTVRPSRTHAFPKDHHHHPPPPPPPGTVGAHRAPTFMADSAASFAHVQSTAIAPAMSLNFQFIPPTLPPQVTRLEPAQCVCLVSLIPLFSNVEDTTLCLRAPA